MSGTETAAPPSTAKPKLAPEKIYAVLGEGGKIVSINDAVEKIDSVFAGNTVVVYKKVYAKRLIVKQNLSIASVCGA